MQRELSGGRKHSGRAPSDSGSRHSSGASSSTAHRIDSGSHMSAKDRIVSADSGEQCNDLYPGVMCSILVMCIDARSSDSAGVTRRREAGICIIKN